ncbi:hypothetical protein CR205_12905 [Alteribacter lacisalsi]|uniref:Uncharacterized protein n=2 Tax=Alteribacter lacisalsi TaxID=2045244 RepID=A0A2W0H438_9BACI|nr:hypothetical protein CR205_12905 [Alteribacter lacisalsi]
MYYFPYRQEWSSVLELLNQSLFGEGMVCSMTTQLFYIPATAGLEGNPELHRHLIPASYHRVTAVGSVYRLQNGEFDESIIQTLISCVNKGLQEDQEVMRWLQVMRDNAPEEFESFIENIINWQQRTEQTLSAAKQLIEQMGYDTENQNDIYY